jgi:hypothetical protein
LLVVWFLYPSWNILAIPAAALAGQVLVNFLVSWACLQSESMRVGSLLELEGAEHD